MYEMYVESKTHRKLTILKTGYNGKKINTQLVYSMAFYYHLSAKNIVILFAYYTLFKLIN